ncbi:UbiA prenyltransferase family-domain-containing protein [Mycena belliarum]|uniref:Protoheme IX farnesyltransferase, mitochondrial n=1 Tax=Mycena belliarum TaxID=1033014 RepID=A0AAD6XS99_9AGAR|nr:UbiA prenyltransferase family-domain-containing protein [Mycena belliae]
MTMFTRCFPDRHVGCLRLLPPLMQRIWLMNASRPGFFHKSFLTRPATLVSPYKHVESLSPRHVLKLYAQLSKSRLSLLVVLTAMSGVALSPLHATVPTLLSTAIGTALCSASANTLNQLQEIPFDAQMARTRMRPLVRRAITPLHAAGFALATGISGPLVLWTMVNPTTALLGASNIALYAGLYTWMKRKSIYNTWVGAVVGALPPLMGWTACGGQLFLSPSYPVHLFLPPFLSSVPVDTALIDNALAPVAFFMLLFSWQLPHFNGLAHLVRASYAQAGYQMLAVLSPRKNALVSLRHAALLVPICSVLIPLSGLTTWTFALTSLVPNAIYAQAAWQFWRVGGEKEARLVFRHSLWYLPVIMALMMLHKQGVDWAKWLGLRDDEDVKSEW